MPAPPAPGGAAGRTRRGDDLAARAAASAPGQLRARPGRAPRQHQHAVAQVERLLDVVGDQQHRARLVGERRRGHSCSSARVIASSDANGSSSSSTGCRPAACARTRPAGASRPTARRARARELRQAEALEERAGPPARLRRARRPQLAAPARRCRAPSATAAAGRAAASARSAQARPRHAAPAMTRPRAPAGPPRSRAASTCRSPRPHEPTTPRGAIEPTPRSASTARAAGEKSFDSRASDRPRAGVGLAIATPSREPHGHRAVCSLRGHYPTGSKGQRREARALWRYLSPLAREPPWKDSSSLPA